MRHYSRRHRGVPKEGPAEINAVPVKMRHRKRIIRSDEGEKKDKKD